MPICNTRRSSKDRIRITNRNKKGPFVYSVVASKAAPVKQQPPCSRPPQHKRKMTSVNQVLALLVLDSDHHRLAVKYCAPGQKLFPTVEEQRSFEKKVIKKLPKPTGRPSESDVAIVGDNQLVLYKIINDVYICVLCSTAENEVILAQVLEGLCQALQSATQMMAFVGNGITKQSVLECLDQVLLVLDEVTDDLGIIMEVEEEKILNRIRMQDEIQDVGEPEPAEKMFQQATQAAKKRLIESLLGGRG